MHLDAHDIACHDLHLTGATFDDPKGKTAPYHPSAIPTCTRSPVRRCVPARSTGCRPGSTTPSLWHGVFRNPVALTMDADGTLLVGMQGADERSTRPNRPATLTASSASGRRLVRWPDLRCRPPPFAAAPVIDHAAAA